MLTQSGLYYPYIHVRDDTWLKAAALYWQRLDRIVPRDYPTQDSRTAKILVDELDFLRNRRPGASAVIASELFLDFLAESGDELVNSLRVQPSGGDFSRSRIRPKDGGLSDEGTIGHIYSEKMTDELVGALSTLGLSFEISAIDGQHRRKSMNYGSATWIAMDSRVAAIYMTVLTRLTAHQFHLDPVTDVPLAHAAMSGLDVEAVASAIVGHVSLPGDERRLDLEQRVAILAIESVVPRNLSLVDAETIVKFRRANEESLGAFQSAVVAAASEVAALPSDVDQGALRDAVNEMTRRHLLQPRTDLAKALNSFGFDAARSLLTFQQPLAATAAAGLAGLATAPILGDAIGGGVALVALGATRLSRRRNLRTQHLPANYLMELGSSLTPESVLQRQIKAIGGR